MPGEGAKEKESYLLQTTHCPEKRRVLFSLGTRFRANLIERIFGSRRRYAEFRRGNRADTRLCPDRVARFRRAIHGEKAETNQVGSNGVGLAGRWSPERRILSFRPMHQVGTPDRRSTKGKSRNRGRPSAQIRSLLRGAQTPEHKRQSSLKKHPQETAGDARNRKRPQEI